MLIVRFVDIERDHVAGFTSASGPPI